jgi:hypothetical protein
MIGHRFLKPSAISLFCFTGKRGFSLRVWFYMGNFSKFGCPLSWVFCYRIAIASWRFPIFILSSNELLVRYFSINVYIAFTWNVDADLLRKFRLCFFNPWCILCESIANEHSFFNRKKLLHALIPCTVWDTQYLTGRRSDLPLFVRKCISWLNGSSAEPNSQFREKYIRNNLIRIRVSLIFKLSGTPD